jgi:hypothetical protein
MKYQILHDSDLGQLTELVNAALSEGWEPCGGICTSVHAGHVRASSDIPRGIDYTESLFAQAVTKAS